MRRVPPFPAPIRPRAGLADKLTSPKAGVSAKERRNLEAWTRRALRIALGLLAASVAGCPGTKEPAPPPVKTSVGALSAPVLRGATLLSSASGAAPRLRVIGVSAAGSAVELFTGPGCSGTPAALGSAAAFAEPGLDVPVQPDAAAAEVRAAATLAGARSPCSAPFKLELQKAPVADSWKAAGFASAEAARAAWKDTAKAQAALAQALPAALRSALEQAQLAPIAQLSKLRGRTGALLSLDLDADGVRDYALIVLPAGSHLGAALLSAFDAAAPPPPDAELGPLLTDLRRVSLDGGSEVALALGRADSFTFFRRPGNGLAGIAPWKLRDLCNPKAEELADFDWLAAHHAEEVEYLVGESAGSGFLAWDRRGKKVADLPDLCK